MVRLKFRKNIKKWKLTLEDERNQTEEDSAPVDGSEGMREVDLAMGISSKK